MYDQKKSLEVLRGFSSFTFNHNVNNNISHLSGIFL